MNDYPAVLGIYSLHRDEAMGVGATATTHSQVTFWYVRQLSVATVEVQPLSTSLLPSGIRRAIPLDEFIKTHTPEPLYFVDNPLEALNTLHAKVEKGAESFGRAELSGGERALIKALMFDGIMVEGARDKGNVHPDMKEFTRLRSVLRLLAGRGDHFTVEQKTRLNGFGVNLRKNGHLPESITFFSKALELHDRDENIHFNLARAQFDQGDLRACLDTLHMAVDLNPDFDEAHRFIRYCTRKLMAARHDSQHANPRTQRH